jgi:hypothetical protein
MIFWFRFAGFISEVADARRLIMAQQGLQRPGRSH